MTWSLVTVNESHSVDLPPEVTTRAAEVLIELGWTPPPTIAGGFRNDDGPLRGTVTFTSDPWTASVELDEDGCFGLILPTILSPKP